MENLPVDFFVTSHQFTKTTYRDAYPAIDPKSSANSQAGKVIVITGASKGIGHRGFALSFAKANPKGIVLVARSKAALEGVANEISAINNKIEVLAVPTDITNASSVSNLWREVKDKFGKADVLVNNAGTANAGPLAQTPPDVWWGDFEVNVHGAFLVTRGFLNLLGSECKGVVITVITGGAFSIAPGISSYALSKLASLQMQAYIAAETPNVNAFALNPGVVTTDMTFEAFKRFALDSPELAGGTGVWLATESAAFLSGRYLSANWSVEELLQRKEEIVNEGKLKLDLVGKLGKEQFE